MGGKKVISSLDFVTNASASWGFEGRLGGIRLHVMLTKPLFSSGSNVFA